MTIKLLSVASLAAVASVALGQGLSLDLERHRSTIKENSIVSRDTHENLAFSLVNQGWFFSVQLEVGTPAQKVTVSLDTGSSDLWIMSTENPYCAPGTNNVLFASGSKKKRDDEGNTSPVNIVTTATLPDGFYGSWTTLYGNGPAATTTDDTPAPTNTMDCSQWGVFDSGLSSSFEELHFPKDFYIPYVDSTQARGIYFTDEFLINGIAIPNITAALALESNSSHGVMGITYVEDEGSTYSLNKSERFTYPNFPVSLKESGIISKISYSMYLNSLWQKQGVLLFGAVDHSLYTGQLYTIPIVNTFNPKNYPKPIQFDVTVNGVGLVGWESSTQKRTLTQTPFAAVLDSGTSLIELPPGLIDLFTDAVGAVWSEEIGWYVMECPTDRQFYEAAYVFDFNGAHIYSPINNYIYTTTDPRACALGVFPYTYNGGLYNNYGMIGDVVLTSMYVVYNLEDYEISIAQADYSGYYGNSNIEEIVSTVPGAIKAPNYSSSWSSWAPITGFEGDGVGLFTYADEQNPWTTTSNFGAPHAYPYTTTTKKSSTKKKTSTSSTKTRTSHSTASSTSVTVLSTYVTATSTSVASSAIPTTQESTFTSNYSISTTETTGSSTTTTSISSSPSVLSNNTSPASTVPTSQTSNDANDVYVTITVASINAAQSTTTMFTTSCNDIGCATEEYIALLYIGTTTIGHTVSEYTTYSIVSTIPVTSASSSTTVTVGPTVTTGSSNTTSTTASETSSLTSKSSPVSPTGPSMSSSTAVQTSSGTTVPSLPSVSSGSDVSSSSSGAAVSTTTATTDTTTVVTVTSCVDHTCVTNTSSALVSIATTTSSGVVTEYTTYCPLTSIVTTDSTTVVTVTSCDDNKCTTSASPALVSVATTTVSGVVTEYTTYCPLTAATVTKDTTTIVTITSCDDHTCTTSESPALVSVATTATSGVVTEYTTYCPLTAATSTETPVAPITTEVTETPVAPVTTEVTETPVAPVTTAITETPVAPVTTVAGSSVVTLISSASTDSVISNTALIFQNVSSSTAVTVFNDNAGVKVGFSLMSIIALFAFMF